MSDKFTETNTTDYSSRIINSLLGVLIGIGLFIGSFGVLYSNEGRLNLAKVAETAIETPATGSSTAKIGDLISVTGTLTSPETSGDPPYLTKGEYIALRRTSEMYAWDQDTKTTSSKKSNGKRETTTTYTYETKWDEYPQNSSSFREPVGHENPQKSIESKTVTVKLAKIGNYQLNLNQLQFTLSTKITLNSNNILPEFRSNKNDEHSLFIGNGTLNDPQVGDIRLSYKALSKNIQATVFGSLGNSNQLIPYTVPGNSKTFYRLFESTKEQAVATLKKEHSIFTWIFRVVGFLMMWIGLSLVAEPLSVLLDLVPFLGDLSRTFTGFITFSIAFILSSLTIFISTIIHNPIMLFFAVGLSGFTIYRWLKQIKKPSYL